MGVYFEELSASLKRCHDTKPEFFRSLPRTGVWAELRSTLTGEGARPHTSLRFPDAGAVLEVVLENLRG